MTGLILTAVSGTQRGEQFAFSEKTLVLIGRSRDCDVRLPDATVSRRHCLIELEPYGVWVRDLESLNGTYLNGLRLGKKVREAELTEPGLTSRRLFDGDELSVGEHAFVVNLPVGEAEESNPVLNLEPMHAVA